MNLLLWIIVGGIAGWLASVIMGTSARQGVFMDVIMGILGAIVGGLVMNFFGAGGVTGFNFYSIIVATIGAVLLIALGRALSPRTV